MNEVNLAYLRDNLKYHGFGEALNLEMEQKVREGVPHFRLQFNSTVNGKSFDAVLNFRKADKSDMYFFNSYTAKLDKGVRENIEQTFYINKGSGITAKEAYNLLDGRSVFKELTNKDGVSYHAWMELDPTTKDKNDNHILKQYHTNYGFELGKSLVALPIKELGSDDERMKLIRSLEKGNLQVVTFERNEKDERMFIEANPKFKTLNIYDSKMNRMKKNVENQEVKTFSKKQKSGMNKTDEIKTAKKKSSKKVSGKSDDNAQTGLLPKKRMNKKKG
ncbi:MAG: hypothetical protein M3R72_09730 [Bacteroidota bacterium]|nr:hypothetical protein [Bacteroidota bacterium]